MVATAMTRGNDKGLMPDQNRWKPGKRDAIFLAIVVAVITALILGTGKRTTKPTPDDAVHQRVTSHMACMQCHGPGGVRPQPAKHTRATQCFQCHKQPAGWQGVKR